MRTHPQWSLLLLTTAVLAAVLQAGRADDNKQDETKPAAAGEHKDIDRLAFKALRDVINNGAEMYNAGDVAGCWRLYEGGLILLRPMLEHRPELQKTISDGIANARQNPFMDRRAWVLREVIDKVRNDLNPNPKPAHLPKPKPRPEEEKNGKSEEKKKEIPPADKKDGEKKEPSATKPPEKPVGTLWSRLGGEDKVASVVDDFWDAVKNDKNLRFFRKPGETPTPKQVNDLKTKIIAFISSVTEGPIQYTGKTMKEAHKGMEITDKEFDTVAKHLEDALKKNGVKDDDIKELMRKLNATRPDIVEKK